MLHRDIELRHLEDRLGEPGPGRVGRAREMVEPASPGRSARCAAIFRQAAAMSAAGVGPPIWSSTTRS
jgi:hypothetical protein